MAISASKLDWSVVEARDTTVRNKAVLRRAAATFLELMKLSQAVPGARFGKTPLFSSSELAVMKKAYDAAARKLAKAT